MMLGGADLFEGMLLREATPSIPWIWPVEDVLEILQKLDGIVIIQRTGSEVWEPETIRVSLKGKLQEGGVQDLEFLDSMDIVVASASAGDGSSTQVRRLIGG